MIPDYVSIAKQTGTRSLWKRRSVWCDQKCRVSKVRSKAAEDSRTPRRFATSAVTAAHPNSARSWSAAVLRRFRLEQLAVADSCDRTPFGLSSHFAFVPSSELLIRTPYRAVFC